MKSTLYLLFLLNFTLVFAGEDNIKTKDEILKEEEFKNLKQIAHAGGKIEQYFLAKLYETGAFVQQDYNQAFQWYKKAAEQDYKQAWIDLAKCYLDGKGVEQNINEAIKWFEKAALNGNADAQKILKNFK